MARKVGERNWGDSDEAFLCHVCLPNKTQHKQQQRSYIIVDEGAAFVTVADRKGNQWHVAIGCDNTLTIEERTLSVHCYDPHVLRAVRKHLRI